MTTVSCQIVRTSLIERIYQHQGPVIVSAGVGSGKSILVEQLRQAGERRVVDDATTADLRCLNDGPILLSRHPLINEIGGRDRSTVMALGEAALWFSIDEVEEVLRRWPSNCSLVESLATSIHEWTHGWPAAVSAVNTVLVERPALARQVDSLLNQGFGLRRLSAGVVDDIAPAVIDEVGMLVNYEPIIPEMIDLLGTVPAWDQLRCMGLPFLQSDDGYLHVPEPIRSELARTAEVPESRLIEWGVQLTGIVGLPAAMRALIGAGAWNALQEVALNVPESALYRTDPAKVLQHLRLLSDLVEPQPAIILIMGALATRLGRIETARSDVDRCLRAAEAVGDELTALSARILRATIEVSIDPLSVKEADLADLERRQREVGSVRSGLRLKRLRFMMMSQRHDVASLTAALRLGEDVAQGLADVGEPMLGAEQLREVAFGPMLYLGRYNDIVATDERATVLAGQTVPTERCLVFRAVAKALAGDLNGHREATEELERAFGRSSAEWLAAYLWASHMMAAALTGSRHRVEHAFERYRETIGELAGTQSDLFWIAAAAEAHAIVGSQNEAEALLATIDTKLDVLPAAVGKAIVVVNARAGRLDAASRAAAELAERQVMSADYRWRVELELLLAGNPGPTEREGEIARVLDLAALAGCADLARTLLDGADPTDCAAGPTTPVRVNVFGVFTVIANGERSDSLTGKPCDMIKLLILRGGRVHVEAAIDALWPDADVDSGRRRMKNVVKRARSILGDENLLRRGDLLVLSDDVGSDLLDFRATIAAAKAAPPASLEFRRAARRAIEISVDGLLPADRYAEWASDDRWRIESTIAKLHGKLEPPLGPPEAHGRRTGREQILKQVQ